MVTVCARDNLQKFLFIMLELCLVPDVAYYAQFSARLICRCLTIAQTQQPALNNEPMLISYSKTTSGKQRQVGRQCYYSSKEITKQNHGNVL